MRKLLIMIAGLAATAAAVPAGAQSFPAPENWGFGYEKYGQVRFLKVRLERIQGRIRQMDHRHQITGRSGERLIEEANAIQRHLRNDAAFGLTPQQAKAMEARIIRLERKVNASYAERDRRTGATYAYPSDDWRRDASEDRDRNERDDRWEDDYRIDSPVEPR